VSNERLRQLERAFNASGAAEDETAYLLERVRRDDLDPRRLELAAYLGHEPARSALGEDAPPDPRSVSLLTWGRGLKSYDKQACPRAVLAVMKAALDLWEPGADPENPTLDAQWNAKWADKDTGAFSDPAAWHALFIRIFVALEGYVLRPGAKTKAALRELVPDVNDDDSSWYLNVPLTMRVAWGWALSKGPGKAAQAAAGDGTDLLAKAFAGDWGRVRAVHQKRARKVVLQALLPWALGPQEPPSKARRSAKKAPRKADRVAARATSRSQSAGADSPTLDAKGFRSPLAFRVFALEDGKTTAQEIGRTPGTVAVEAYARWWVRPSGVRVLSKPSAFQGLPGLWLRGLTVRDPHLERVGKLQSLRWLALRGCELITDAGLTALRGLDALEALELWGCRGVRGSGFKNLPLGLRELDLNSTQLSPSGVRDLARFEGLRRLDLSRCTLSPDELGAALAGMPALEELDLTESKRVGDACLTGLAGSTRLQRLSLKHLRQVTDRGLGSLAGLSELRHLNLWGCRIKGQGLSCLQGLPQLEELVLAETPLEFEAIKQTLPKLTQLRRLDLRDCDERIYRWARALARPGLELRTETLL
jgi:hypothetical protein